MIPDAAAEVILGYHSISSEGAGLDARYRTTKFDFQQQMELVRDAASDVTANDEEGQKRRQYRITFDDAYDDVGDVGLPVLDQLGLRGEIYVVTDFIGIQSGWHSSGRRGKITLDWSQLGDAVNSGHLVGSHSCSHRKFETLSLVEVRVEATKSKQILETKLGIEITSFAVPYGYCTKNQLDVILAAGYNEVLLVGWPTSYPELYPSVKSRCEVRGDCPWREQGLFKRFVFGNREESA